MSLSQNNSSYLRYRTIYKDSIAFVSEDDLWILESGSSTPRRLTANLSEVTRPIFSPDGKWIAFTSREEFHPECYCMPAEGGPATRLSYFGESALTTAWSPEGKIIFTSAKRQPFANSLEGYSIGVYGQDVEVLPYGPFRNISFGPNNRVVLGKNTADPARWKRYRGGMAGEVWIETSTKGHFEKLIDLAGNIASPMWFQERIFFLSDHQGIGNLYSCQPDGTDLVKHSNHQQFYARLAQTDGNSIVYQNAGDIWIWNMDMAEPQKLDIDLKSPRVQRNRKFVPTDKYLNEYAIDPEGKCLALTSRGQLFSMQPWQGAVKNYGKPNEVRYRLPSWIDNKTFVVISDEGGEESLEIYNVENFECKKIKPHDLDWGFIKEIKVSPDSNHIAWSNNRHQLWMLQLNKDDGHGPVLLDHSPYGSLRHLNWSSDSRWLTYSFANSANTSLIKVIDFSCHKNFKITSGEFKDIQPVFDPDSKYLYFLSLRIFDPVYDAVFFDLGFPKAMKPYMVTLQKDTLSPFESKKEPDEKKESDVSSKEEQKTVPVLDIDLEGIQNRIIPMPLPEGRYGQLGAIKNKIIFTSSPVKGSLKRDIFDLSDKDQNSLESFEISTQEHEVLLKGISNFVLSRDGLKLAYRSGNRLRVISAGQKPNEKAESEAPGVKSGWIDLARVKVSVIPQKEWRQMLVEAWRLQRENFWTPDMSGLDWDQVLQSYISLVDKVSTRQEFSDLMWEMQGELGTSHAYELGGDYRSVPAYSMGHLGADIDYDSNLAQWKISKIINGNSWDPTEASPLSTPGILAEPGQVILSINGQKLDENNSPGSLLVNQAGSEVELEIASPGIDNSRKVVVKTIKDERKIRYRQWVRTNRELVSTKSDNKIGYIHIPDMGPYGFSEFNKYYLSELQKSALIIDVRFNGGGHVSQVILEKIARKRIGFDVSRWGPMEPYPSDSPSGPLVVIANEFAGSDGDIFTHCFKLLSLGPVIGRRTWGGVIGISPSHGLVDGSVTTQPEYAFWFKDVGWGVENYGTDPDIEVDILPQDYALGVDPQLQRAIEVAQAKLKDHKSLMPDLENRPKVTLWRNNNL